MRWSPRCSASRPSGAARALILRPREISGKDPLSGTASISSWSVAERAACCSPAICLRNDDDDIRVTLIEKRQAVGRGMAYSTAQPGHLLNVRATNMSAFADDPLHFCRWLAEHDEDAQGEQPGPLTFAQRRVYGRYIAELITPHLGTPGEPGRLQVIYGEGRSIATTPSGVESHRRRQQLRRRHCRACDRS